MASNARHFRRLACAEQTVRGWMLDEEAEGGKGAYTIYTSQGFRVVKGLLSDVLEKVSVLVSCSSVFTDW